MNEHFFLAHFNNQNNTLFFYFFFILNSIYSNKECNFSTRFKLIFKIKIDRNWDRSRKKRRFKFLDYRKTLHKVVGT